MYKKVVENTASATKSKKQNASWNKISHIDPTNRLFLFFHVPKNEFCMNEQSIKMAGFQHR